jgi:hypothetical protein
VRVFAACVFGVCLIVASARLRDLFSTDTRDTMITRVAVVVMIFSTIRIVGCLQ